MNPVVQVLEFIFRSFWTWAGCLMLLAAVFSGPKISIKKYLRVSKDSKNSKW